MFQPGDIIMIEPPYASYMGIFVRYGDDNDDYYYIKPILTDDMQ